MAEIEGVDYSTQGISEIREQLIELRNGAFSQGEMMWVVLLSHAIAMLADYAEVKHGSDITTHNLGEDDNARYEHEADES